MNEIALFFSSSEAVKSNCRELLYMEEDYHHPERLCNLILLFVEALISLSQWITQ